MNPYLVISTLTLQISTQSINFELTSKDYLLLSTFNLFASLISYDEINEAFLLIYDNLSLLLVLHIDALSDSLQNHCQNDGPYLIQIQ